MALPRASDVQYVGDNGPNGVVIGFSSSKKVGFYGATPVIRRAYSSAVHASSALASSTDFGATQLAWAQEVTKTLTGLGIWATA
jgi:hypothetical protein